VGQKQNKKETRERDDALSAFLPEKSPGSTKKSTKVRPAAIAGGQVEQADSKLEICG
jgi:hypothetical protein